MKVKAIPNSSVAYIVGRQIDTSEPTRSYHSSYNNGVFILSNQFR